MADRGSQSASNLMSSSISQLEALIALILPEVDDEIEHNDEARRHLNESLLTPHPSTDDTKQAIDQSLAMSDDLATNKAIENDEIYVIGNNGIGQLGLDHDNIVYKLTNWNDYNECISITDIKCAYHTTVFINYNPQNKHFWVCGDCTYGSCGVGLYDQYIVGCREIEYFKNKNMNIIKVCTDISAPTIFWISDNHRLYASGCNEYYQLGLGDTKNRIFPTLMKELYNVIDVQSGYFHSIALCRPSISIWSIIPYWVRERNMLTVQNEIFIDNDIIALIEMYFDINKVNIYSTGQSEYGGNGHGTMHYDVDKVKKWKKIDIFDNKEIIKIQCGYHHSFFLESNGNLWCCGKNKSGQLGLGHFKTSKYLQSPFVLKVKYFINHKVKIKDIKCGLSHNLCIDYNANVFSWGSNEYGECGNGTVFDCNLPKLIDTLRKYNIVKIKCGARHSYVMTNKNKHFLFGDNRLNESSLSIDDKDRITLPHCINPIVHKITDGRIIKDVYLGYNNTIIVTM